MIKEEWEKIGVELSNIANILENAGGDYIVIATNMIHKLVNDIQRHINVPLIHIADCVAEKCKDKKVENVVF